MANYYSWMVTTHTFHVEDTEAFRKELIDAGVSEGDWGGGLTFVQEEDGSFWLGGYDASLERYNSDKDEEVSIVPIVQRHIKSDDYAMFQIVGQEKLRYVVGVVIVVTKTIDLSDDLDQMGGRLLKEAKNL